MNHRASSMRFQYCDKNNHNTDDLRKISKFKQQKKAFFEAKYGPGKKSS
jgi:predicted TIM-barrel fold metal-dependent hydrolase